MAIRPYTKNRVERFVNYYTSRKKVCDKKKLYYKCLRNIPICKNMTYNSFASILKTMSTIKADKKSVVYIGNKEG